MSRRLPSGLSLGLLVLLGAQLAHWTWVFVAPARSPVAIPTRDDSEQSAERIRSAHLFGQASQRGAPVINTSAGLNAQLKGVFAAADPAVSYAIVNAGAGDVTVHVGDELQPGARLRSVHPTYIVVDQAGVLKRLNLPQAPGEAKLGVGSVGYNRFRVSRSELNAALQSGDGALKTGGIGAAPGGGVVITDATQGSLAQRLGLQVGDVVRQVNGQFVAAPADLSRLAQQWQTGREATQVQLELQRAGRIVQLHYTVQP